jgi:DNA gyrase subunit A
MVVTISHNGFIKRNSLDLYRSQRRGGKGAMGMETREEDFVETLFTASTHDTVLFFSNLGRIYWLKVYQIPEMGRAAKGKAIVNLLQISPRERITAVFSISEFKDDTFLVMATKNGVVKKTVLTAYSHPRSTGINAIKLEDGDELIGVRLTDGTQDINLSTMNGLSIRFNEGDVRAVGRVAQGVRGIRLKQGDEVVSVDVLDDETALLTVTEKGYGKRTKADAYRLQSRGGKGIFTIKVTAKNGQVVGVLQVTNDDEIIIIASSGKVIRTNAKSISLIGRATQGVRLIDLTDDDKVVSVARVVDKEEEENGKSGELFKT